MGALRGEGKSVNVALDGMTGLESDSDALTKANIFEDGTERAVRRFTISEPKQSAQGVGVNLNMQVNDEKKMTMLRIGENDTVVGGEKVHGEVSKDGKTDSERDKFNEMNKVISSDEDVVRHATELDEVKLETNVTPKTKKDATTVADLEQAKLDLNEYLERAAMARLAEMERLADKRRQEKIRRREELDRVARLQRILALVRAPELDSVAKIKQGDTLKLNEMTSGKEVKGINKTGGVAEMTPEAKKVEMNADTELNKLVESQPKQIVTNNQITDSGIIKLERMSKTEHILEIDRLSSLEHKAEAKHNADIERKTEVERVAELERMAKMKRTREINLAAEIERAEKERLEERLEKLRRREEKERVARLQRLLAMVRASESDYLPETQKANTERAKEINGTDEMKLLEELGILPKQQGNETKSGVVDLVENKTLVLDESYVPDTNPVKNDKPEMVLKDDGLNSIKVTKTKATEIKQLPEVKVANVGQLIESDKAIEAKRVANIKPALKIEDKIKVDHDDAKMKQKEELARVANLQRVIASVRNTESDRVSEMKNAKEIKRKEEIKVLQQLGIISKDKATHTNETQVKPVEDAKQLSKVNLDTKIIPVEEVDIDGQISVNDGKPTELLSEKKVGMVADLEKEAKIKRAAEMERKAKADREARIKQKEEFNRVANLQRVVAMVHNEDFDHVSAMKREELKCIAENKRREDMKVLDELGILSKVQIPQENETERQFINNQDSLSKNKVVDEVSGGINLKEAVKVGSAKIPFDKNVDRLSENKINIEQVSEEQMVDKQNIERRLAELSVAQMKLVAELGREMKEVTMKNEAKLKRNDSKNVADEVTEIKLVGKPSDLSSPRVKREVEIESAIDMTRHKNSKQTKDFRMSEVGKDVEAVIGLKGEVRSKSANIPWVFEVKGEPEMKSVEMKRLFEMKRVAGLERLKGRDCEWDGQMMYAGKA